MAQGLKGRSGVDHPQAISSQSGVAGEGLLTATEAEPQTTSDAPRTPHPACQGRGDGETEKENDAGHKEKQDKEETGYEEVISRKKRKWMRRQATKAGSKKEMGPQQVRLGQSSFVRDRQDSKARSLQGKTHETRGPRGAYKGNIRMLQEAHK